MSAKTQDVIDAVTDVTKDYDRARFLLPEISRWMNHGAKQIVSLDARAGSQYRVLTLLAGARQDLRLIDPATSWVRLHELVCNATAAGEPTGDTIRKVARTVLDTSFKKWRGTAVTATAVKECMQDEREEFTFDVYPPVTAGTKVLALASVRPAPFCVLDAPGTALANPNETVPLADGFEIPLIDYTLFRLFNKDTNDQAYERRAAMHLEAFKLALGVEVKDAAQ